MLKLKVTPAGQGEQVVRASVPVPAGELGAGQTWVVRHAGGVPGAPAGVRVLTKHPSTGGARRVMVTWLHTFRGPGRGTEPVEFTLEPVAAGDAPAGPRRLPVSVKVVGEEVQLAWDGGPVLKARLIAPARASKSAPGGEVEVVENNALYHWQRVRLSDPDWPRVIEVRADAAGQVVLVAHVRRDLPGNDYAPDLGWELDSRHLASQLVPGDAVPKAAGKSAHVFADGEASEFRLEDPPYVAYHPAAPFRRKGSVRVAHGENGRTLYRYLRSEAGDKTPMQQAAWQRFEMVIAPAGLARLRPTLESPHAVEFDASAWDELYGTGEALDVSGSPELQAALDYHHGAIRRTAAIGDDWGNLTFYSDDNPGGTVFGMNRINHCPPIFEQGWRSGDRALTETAVLWCENFHDLSIWWGPQHTGGTRYNNGPVVDHFAPEGDPGKFLWRSNRAINFCTKGYDAFLLAYEQTGDPRMLEAMEAQATWAGQQVRCSEGECRNIGDVRDFVRLYRCTGEARFLAHAKRLFAELSAKLWDNGLFDQGGRPRTDQPDFIDDDATGVRFGFAKPYIIGYALAGLPELLTIEPELPRLRQVVQAVADFLAESQDPAGGWRYPHPRSSILGFQLEQAWQLVQADKALGAQEKHLDAIERVLRARLHGWLRTGRVLSHVTGWERSTGYLQQTGKTMADLYKRPEDRGFERDYDEGEVETGASAPEGLVYFPEVLAFYLKHRPAERLLRAPAKDEPLGRILARLPAAREVQTVGVVERLPVFWERAAKRLTYPLSWANNAKRDFAVWKREAKAKVLECLLTPPPSAAFAPMVLDEQDRGSYVARKLALNVSGDSRVLAYMLVPKGRGPFPGALLLHDHGAKFDIGKEKVIEPFDDTPERLASAREWVGKCYGGRFIGDELAKRGYVCFATDMLNWSDRSPGRDAATAGAFTQGSAYDIQQALASNLMYLGMSWAGVIAHEDLRAAEFLATRPEVDAKRVVAMGLSVGAFRTWRVAALSPHVTAGAAICWMATVAGQMKPGVNQTTGQSAFAMLAPGLSAHLDFPDIASLACPKPMLFYNGLRDGLFDPADTQAAFAKMRAVWDAQGAGAKLETRMWDVPHVFDAAMQEAAFAWAGRQFEGV